MRIVKGIGVVMISLSKVTKVQGKHNVLDNISFEVKKGEFVVCVSPDADTRTALLECLGRITKPDSGNIRVGELDLSNLKRETLRFYKSKVNLISYNAVLNRRDTVYDNVALPLKCTNLLSSQIARVVSKAISLLKIENNIQNRCLNLSDFLKIKVLISRAVAQNSEILLLDDPLSRLNHEEREIIINILKDLNKRLGCTIIVTVPKLSQLENKSSLRVINIEDAKDLNGQANDKDRAVASITSKDNLKVASKDHEDKATSEYIDKKVKVVIENLISTQTVEDPSVSKGIIYTIATELRLPFEIGEGKVVPLDNTIKEKFSLVVDEKYLKVLADFLEKRAISFELSN